MSLQTFESVPNTAVCQPYPPDLSQLSFPDVEVQSIPTFGQQDAQLADQQYATAADATDEVKVALDESNALPEEPNPSMEEVLRDIQRAYDNGLFQSFRDQIPSYYPELPGVVMVDENGVPIEEPPAQTTDGADLTP